jgi:lysylphosphatidylglycerol synthetase-like protein (DUF2156 family)
MLWFGLSSFIGLLIAFIISLVISIKNYWHWANSVIAFLLGFILARTQYSIGKLNPAYYVNYLLNAKFSTFYLFVISSIIMMSVAVLLFLLKRVINFINAGNPTLVIITEQTN